MTKIETTIYDSTEKYSSSELSKVSNTIYNGSRDLFFGYLHKHNIKGEYRIEMKVIEIKPSTISNIEEVIERR